MILSGDRDKEADYTMSAPPQLLRWVVPIKSQRISRSAIEVLRAGPLTRIPWLVHGFSTRQGGASKVYGGKSLNLGYTVHDTKSAVARNRRAFAKAVVATRASSLQRSRLWPLVTVRQIHSDLIHCVSGHTSQALSGDGLITRTPGILLGVLAADCLPIIIGTAGCAVGVFHARRRGTQADRREEVGEINVISADRTR
jgi:copper oxidase (laccase) domain-containing protein